MKALSKAVGALCAVFALALSALAAGTYTWTADGNAIGSAAYVKIFDDVGAFTGRLRLVGFSTAEGDYTVTSNRLHEATSTQSAIGALPAGSYVHQMSAGARFDGTTTKSIRVQLAQPAGSNALYARITAIATATGDHMKKPDLRVAIKDDKTVAGTILESAADLAANAVTKIVVGVANDTIAYWPFGENGFSDVSGNRHNLEGVNVTESDAAYMSLNDGRTDQYLKTASALDLSAENAVTFECWCRQTAHPASTYNIVFASETPADGTGGFVLYNAGQYQAQMRVASNGWQLDYTPDTSFADGMWHHVAYVVDRTRTDQFSCRLYIDGVQQTGTGRTGSVTYDMSVPALFNSLFMIGGGAAYSAAGSNYYRGYIDDVRISRGVVAPEDFLKYPTVGKKMRADDGKLPVVAYWPFGGKRGRDATGNGFDLTMSESVPMVSGTPKVDYGVKNSWNGDFKCANLPFSVFSKAGVTIEFFARTSSGDTAASNILTLSPDSSYYNHAGAFRIGPHSTYGGTKSMSATVCCKDNNSGFVDAHTTEAEFGALNDDKWRHFAVVYDPSKVGNGIWRLYVDGVETYNKADVADQGAIAFLDTVLYFQRINYNNSISMGYVGWLDDVRITAGALTPDQFLASRSNGSTVALYRLDKETLEDQSGNGNDLIHMRTEANVAEPVFGDADYPNSGTGLVFTGVKGTKEWVKSSSAFDFSESKMLTVEVDYNSGNPTTLQENLYVMAATEQVASRGGFVVYRTGDALQAQHRNTNGSGWLKVYAQAMGALTANGYNRGRYSVNARNSSKIDYNLCVDGTSKESSASTNYGALGSHVLCFGHSPSYGGDNETTPKYLTGKILRIAISDVALDPADYVLDNLIDPETKRTLAYWNFKNFGGLTVPSGSKTSAGGLLLNGSNYATTTNLTLSTLTQATIECFVNFGATPTSGTIFSLGSGAGSFAVASDASAGTLSGTFIPYDHMAASNGGVAALDPLAGRKDWHHVALVIDRTASGADAVKFYVDYERAMPAGRAWDKAATILDGALAVGTGFTGRIDDLRVSAGALEPSEFMHERTESVDGMLIIVR